MDEIKSPQSQMTVEKVLADFPQTAGAFMALRTSCVGCHLARFCTLEDVAREYKLPLDDLLAKLRETIQSSQKE